MEARIMEEVYLRLHNFIYRKCGFSLPIKTNGLSDSIVERIRRSEPSAFSPDKIGNIYKGVSINNIKGSKDMVIKHRVFDSNKLVVKPIIKGKIAGFVTLSTGLPVFQITIKYFGQELTRILMPQNPWKSYPDTGYYSKPAQEAQNGNQITWVINPDNNVPFNKRWIAKITNGDIQYF
jgi:hypothetical protein